MTNTAYESAYPVSYKVWRRSFISQKLLDSSGSANQWENREQLHNEKTNNRNSQQKRNHKQYSFSDILKHFIPPEQDLIPILNQRAIFVGVVVGFLNVLVIRLVASA